MATRAIASSALANPRNSEVGVGAQAVGHFPEVGLEFLDTDQVVSTHGVVVVFQVEGRSRLAGGSITGWYSAEPAISIQASSAA
jgi:hypothetical protein